ncbi:uncharacterized protein LOC134527369 isoform X2 [Bacillus rossius redtenbacheri]|uniref:uncharacterized protein LOC134527369 isoform X2 n=1 Tax=Bacillus rossius redtenbacheri TaxID=93214 RepID=UPI002FDE40EE
MASTAVDCVKAAQYSFLDTMTDEITDQLSSSLAVSSVLRSCKSKILQPYLRLLALMGLRPLAPGAGWRGPLDCLYLGALLVLLCVGYLLQYMACFRRDRGFYFLDNEDDQHERVCYGSVMFSYILPSCLHCAGYVYALRVFRQHETEQLQNLMERVFLSSSSPASSLAVQRQLVRMLWLFVGLSVLWTLVSLVADNVLMADSDIEFCWLESSPASVTVPLKILLTLSTLWHDVLQATIIAGYCLQAQLLISHARFLNAKLLELSVSPAEWMRELAEFRKLLDYLNEDFAPIVCIFTILNMSCAASGIIWLLQLDVVDNGNMPSSSNLANILLWIIISAVPFIQIVPSSKWLRGRQAARLSNACRSVREVGHEMRGKHLQMCEQDLDRLLLFSSSLRLSGQLFHLAITDRYVYATLGAAAVVVLVLGECHMLV